MGYIIYGDEVIFERKIYSTYDYKEKLLEDLKESNKEIVFIINDFDAEELKYLLDINNARVLVNNKAFVEHKNISSLDETGLLINAIIIDQKLLWYGGINPFKAFKYSDSIMRINDRSICETIIKEAKKKNA